MVYAYSIPEEKDRLDWNYNQLNLLESAVYTTVKTKVGASCHYDKSKPGPIDAPTVHTRTFRQHYVIDLIYQYALMHYLHQVVIDPTENIYAGTLANKILSKGYGHNHSEKLV